MSFTRTSELRARDVAELVVGAGAIALPIAMSQDRLSLASELSLPRTLRIAVATICVTGVLVWFLYHHGEEPEQRQDLLLRVLAGYGLTLVLSAVLLHAIDRLDLSSDPILALKRTILVAFPASFAGTAVDSIGN